MESSTPTGAPALVQSAQPLLQRVACAQGRQVCRDAQPGTGALAGEDDFGKPADGERQRALGPWQTNAERFVLTLSPQNEAALPCDKKGTRRLAPVVALLLPRRECGAGSKFSWSGLNIADRTLPNPGIMKSAIVVAQPWFLEAGV